MLKLASIALGSVMLAACSSGGHRPSGTKIEVEAVAEVRAFEVLQPARIPGRLHLQMARILAPEDTTERCQQVVLAYGWELMDHALKLYSMTPECSARVKREEPSREFSSSGLTGWIATETPSGIGLVAAVLADERRAVVAVQWGVSIAELETALGELIPFTSGNVTGLRR